MIRCLAIVALAACAPAAAQPMCLLPVTYDRAGILAAAAGGCAELEAGAVYTVATPAQPRAFAVLDIGSAALNGNGATIRFVGDAGGSDWWGIATAGGAIRGLTYDISALTGTSEQTHGIRVNGPSFGTTIDDVTCLNPDRGLPGGDCVQVVGYPATSTTPDRVVHGLRIRHSRFTADRSGVAIHSGTQDLEISDNAFLECGDQCIDSEGQNGGNTDWLIARNTFALGAHPQGDLNIALQLVDRIRITDNKLWGRGIFAFGASHAEIDHNTIVLTVPGSGDAVVEIKKASSYVDVHDNTLIRAATAGLGYTVRASPQNSRVPDHVSVRNNSIIQATTGDIVNAVGIVGLNVEGNVIAYSGLAGKGYGVLVVSGGSAAAPVPTRDISVIGNTWVGPLAGCLGLDGARGVGAVATAGNVALGPAKGVVCGNTGGITGPIVSTGNSWAPPTGCLGVPTQ